VRLRDLVGRLHPEVQNPEAIIAAGRVHVDRVVRTNPAALVRADAAVTVVEPVTLRGEAKLRRALAAFPVSVAGRVALDVGAAAGGFTRVLLAAGARRVYAVDAGHGQLIGSLRQDARVVNLEATNVGALTVELVPDVVDAVTIDVSNLSLAAAAAQVNHVQIAANADLIGLVKPMFELRLGALPTEPELLARALEAARSGLVAAGWCVVASVESPVRGARGAIEFLVHARRSCFCVAGRE
jgi:23S rRNA (cytidine1920-2'-O)/16S rRNA (cytidine1409-2'-O)-methyltransferase